MSKNFIKLFLLVMLLAQGISLGKPSAIPDKNHTWFLEITTNASGTK